MVQENWPVLPLAVPAAQAMQTVAPAPLYRPVGQGLQLDCPVWSWKVPGRQPMALEAPMARLVAEAGHMLPAGQVLHCTEATTLVKEPGAQGRQLVAPGVERN